jgi:Zn-dependent protease with chaperone function
MNKRESSVRATLLFLLLVPVSLIFVTSMTYDISYAVTGRYSFTFSSEHVGYVTGDGSVITWVPTYVLGLFLRLFPFLILARAFLLRSSVKNLQLLKDPEILNIANEAAEIAEIDLPPLYGVTSQQVVLDVFGTDKTPLIRLSSRFADIFREKPEKLKALLLHEYSHILHKDVGLLTLKSSFIQTLGIYLLVSSIYQCYNMYRYAVKYVAEIPPSEMGTKVVFRILGDEFMFFLSFVLLFLLVNSIYREREFLADWKTSFLLKNSVLISALRELERVIPKGVHIEVFSDHPSIQKRIDALEGKRSPSFIAPLFWTALTLAFCVLLVTHCYGETTIWFFSNQYALERFYGSTGRWIQVTIDVLFPVTVMLYFFKFGGVKSFLSSVARGSLCCGGYAAFVLGYDYFMQALRRLGVSLPEVTNILNIFGWGSLPGVNRIRYFVIILFHKMSIDLPSRLENMMREWLLVLFVMILIFLMMSGCIFVIQKIYAQKVPTPSRWARLLLIAVLQILLIVGGIASQLPREDKDTTLKRWVMSYYKVYDYTEHGVEYVKAGSFDFDTQYDIEDNFYGIRILSRTNGLTDLTLDQRDELIRWLRFHQDEDGEFSMMFYFFGVEGDEACVGEESFILLSLKDLNGIDSINREGAIQYALSRIEDYPWDVFNIIQTLSVLDAVDRMDEELQALVKKYFSDFDYEPNPNFPLMCYEGFHSCGEIGWECILCAYWGVLTLQRSDMLDSCDKEAITDEILNHYVENGGFCEGLLIDWRSEPSQIYKGPPDLKSTYHAVKSLQALDQLSSIDREKTIQYVLSFQTRKGGFARTQESEPTFEDTYFAVEILDALHAIDRLEEPYRVPDVLLEILQSLSLAFYIVVGVLIAVDLWLYYRVWK